MSRAPNRWRVVLIERDGAPGPVFWCRTVTQRCLIVLALHAAGATFMVEEFAA